MDISVCVNQKKEIYNTFLEFVDSENEEDEKEKYKTLINLFNELNILENSDEIIEFLTLVNKISMHHQRHPCFLNRIEKTITFFESKIKQTFTNFQLFNLFKDNKIILLFLLNNQIIEVDEYIYQFFYNKSRTKDTNFETYYEYFYYQLKNCKLAKHPIYNTRDFDPNKFENFEEKCQAGVNDSYICQLIRNDSIDEFISYISRTNIPLTSKIQSSFFETNSFLINSNPSLIEYAAFYGSIQIYQYLRINEAEIKPPIWLYAIHGRNPEIIHKIEEDHIEIEYNDILEEAVKCHHNEIANYFENMLLENQIEKPNYFKKLFKFIKTKIPNQPIESNDEFKFKDEIGLKYHNFEFMPENFNNPFLFKYFCEYNYITFCKLFFKYNMVKINEKFVLTNNSFLFIKKFIIDLYCMELIV